MSEKSMAEKVTTIPTVSTAETVHLPRLIVQDSCIENCGKLVTRAASATFEAAKNPSKQIDVICSGKSGLLKMCGAEELESGRYDNDRFGVKVDGEEGHYLSNPSLYERWPGTFTVGSQIQKAIDAGGSEHFISEL